jgi:hypothetical protein
LHYRTYSTTRRRPGQLAVRRRSLGDQIGYIGSIDGRDCVYSPTPEGARIGLLRRLCVQRLRERDLL